jgi:hypothetical protein
MHAFPGCSKKRAQWLPPFGKGGVCIALAAYSCRDSLGFGKGRTLPHRVPIQALSGTGAIIREAGKPLPWSALRLNPAASQSFMIRRIAANEKVLEALASRFEHPITTSSRQRALAASCWLPICLI